MHGNWNAMALVKPYPPLFSMFVLLVAVVAACGSDCILHSVTAGIRDIENLAHLSNLTSLRLDSNLIERIGNSLEANTRLERLGLSDNKIGEIRKLHARRRDKARKNWTEFCLQVTSKRYLTWHGSSHWRASFYQTVISETIPSVVYVITRHTRCFT